MNNLKQLRQSAELSAQGLAVKAKVSTSTVTAIEKWDYLPTSSTQKKIADALDISPRDIWPAKNQGEKGEA